MPARLRAWTRRRLDRGNLRGLPLTVVFLFAMCCLALLGERTEDVLERDVAPDHVVTGFAVSHRTAALTTAMRAVTWLGSSVVLVPLVVAVGAYFVVRYRNAWPGLLLFSAYLGAVTFSNLGKSLVDRARPPERLMVVETGGHAFPSGHATQAMAVYAMLALVLALRRTPGQRALIGAAAAAVILLVGASRVYLGVHWFSDVLAGFALGGAWTAILVSVAILWSTRHRATGAGSLAPRTA